MKTSEENEGKIKKENVTLFHYFIELIRFGLVLQCLILTFLWSIKYPKSKMIHFTVNCESPNLSDFTISERMFST